MTIIITAFEQSPDRGRARDMPVRWALESPLSRRSALP
jgi:hypothetical protein